MTLAGMAKKIATIDQFRKLAANQEIDPEDADTLKQIAQNLGDGHCSNVPESPR
jgi:hypothetical protein